jgi:hypothetical protein
MFGFESFSQFNGAQRVVESVDVDENVVGENVVDNIFGSIGG